MDKAAIITAVSQYDRKLENGENLPISQFGEKLVERTREMLEKSARRFEK